MSVESLCCNAQHESVINGFTIYVIQDQIKAQVAIKRQKLNKMMGSYWRTERLTNTVSLKHL